MNRQRMAGFPIVVLTLLAPGASLAQAPIRLAYNFAPGQTMRQVVDASAEGQLTIEDPGKQEAPVPFAWKGSETFSARINDVKSDGTATLQFSLVSLSVDFKQGDCATSMRAKHGKVVMTAEGVEMSAQPAGRDLFRPVTLRLTSVGVDPDVKEPPSLSVIKTGVDEVGPDSMVMATALTVGPAPALPLPDHVIKVGDSWSQNVNASLPNRQIAQGAITYTLLCLERFGADQVARIGIKGSARASGVSVAMTGEPGKADPRPKVTVDEFTQEIEGTATFLVNKGRLGVIDLTMRLHEMISAPRPTGVKTATITATGKMTVTQTP